jgi:hypothetical protein
MTIFMYPSILVLHGSGGFIKVYIIGEVWKVTVLEIKIGAESTKRWDRGIQDHEEGFRKLVRFKELLRQHQGLVKQSQRFGAVLELQQSCNGQCQRPMRQI